MAKIGMAVRPHYGNGCMLYSYPQCSIDNIQVWKMYERLNPLHTYNNYILTGKTNKHFDSRCSLVQNRKSLKLSAREMIQYF